MIQDAKSAWLLSLPADIHAVGQWFDNCDGGRCPGALLLLH
jgi:hypothetical protein